MLFVVTACRHRSASAAARSHVASGALRWEATKPATPLSASLPQTSPNGTTGGVGWGGLRAEIRVRCWIDCLPVWQTRYACCVPLCGVPVSLLHRPPVGCCVAAGDRSHCARLRVSPALESSPCCHDALCARLVLAEELALAFISTSVAWQGWQVVHPWPVKVRLPPVPLCLRGHCRASGRGHKSCAPYHVNKSCAPYHVAFARYWHCVHTASLVCECVCGGRVCLLGQVCRLHIGAHRRRKGLPGLAPTRRQHVVRWKGAPC